MVSYVGGVKLTHVMSPFLFDFMQAFVYSFLKITSASSCYWIFPGEILKHRL